MIGVRPLEERWTIAGIIAHSSNVGMVQVAQHVSPQTQYQYFRNFGIGSPSVPGLPGQSNGSCQCALSGPGSERRTSRTGRAQHRAGGTVGRAERPIAPVAALGRGSGAVRSQIGLAQLRAGVPTPEGCVGNANAKYAKNAKGQK